MTTVRLKTGAWYQDRDIDLTFPDAWQVTTHWPKAGEPLSDTEIEKRLDDPVAGPALASQLKGARKVAIIVDDLSRPTPAHIVLPKIIKRIREADAGISITIVVATGTHGEQNEKALRQKLGAVAFEQCTIEVHNDLKGTKRIGTTSYKTPVYVNRTVLEADLLIGIGGVYPQHTTGFGGGGKLALGVCGRQSIMGLHFKHKSMEGQYITENDFRKDVCEIAEIIGLRSMITVHIDAFSRIVNLLFGDHRAFYDDAARYSKDCYTAPVASDADVVIANAYPLDTSFTFMRKGYKPLYTAPQSMVKVIIAAAHEGVGVHGLFQYINPSRASRIRNLIMHAWSMDKKILLQKVRNRLVALVQPQDTGSSEEKKTTILPPNTDHLYVWRTDPSGAPIAAMEDVTICEDWQELLDIISRDHFADRDSIRAVLYSCAPIQCIDEQQVAS